MAYQEILWMNELLTSLDIPPKKPISLFCDNQAAIHIAANLVFHERTNSCEDEEATG